ncbi:AfsR/SARP family transcriptional regulator [Streptomyces scopuliridis]|uniref:AfsR/SARP family transcriptional regulator n=1 Tax=Streptomyces scopuliridis TaxID=452529 RepID=UPI001404081B|nr:AfsR/SARP family transcriptional regulator [Streptomyces scopuliridis]
MGTEIEFRVLGVVEVRAGMEWLPLSGKQRSLLAALLLQANRTVTNVRLMDSVWGSPLPVSPETRVRTLVSELRRAFEPIHHNPITTRPSGYLIRIEQGQLDLDTFTSTVTGARHKRSHGQAESAVELYDRALGLWTGPALGGATGPNAEAESARLEEMRLSAQEERFELLLQLGRYAELTADLTPLVMEYPMRERLHAQLMAALHDSGRRSEALDLYMGLRKRLVTELGMEPMPELQQLQQRILAGPADRQRGHAWGLVPSMATRRP